MHRLLSIFLLWSFSLFAQAVDFDVVIIGTSPFCLLEALYRYYTGNRVLILEQDQRCGGAWKSIDVCGVEHVDLGCHQMGHDDKVLFFLENYVGCKMVSLDNPLTPYMRINPNGYYPSGGCYELIDHLLKLIDQTKIVLLVNHRMESITIDPLQPIATVRTKDKVFTTPKIVLPLYADIRIENHPAAAPVIPTSKYPHLYILLEDSGSPRFTYHSSIGSGISRIMNLTHFAGLTGSGKQLIVFQSYGELNRQTGERYLEMLKDRELVGESAQLLSVDSCIYEQGHYTRSFINQTPNGPAVFEILNTGHIQNLSQYISKWQTALMPYQEIMEAN